MRRKHIALFISFIGASAFFALVAVWVGRTPSYAEVRSNYRPSDVWLVDRSGVPLESLRTVKTHRSLEWVSIDEVSPAFTKTLVASEDRRFFEHGGVDLLAVASALRSAVFEHMPRGASTITMQLVKNIDGQSSRSLLGKFRQMGRALELETTWSKNEILEAYFNRVSFRGEIQGLRAASLAFFAKSPVALDDVESRLLVVMLRSPNADLALVQARVCLSLLGTSCDRARDLARTIFETPTRLQRERDVVPVVSKYFIEKEEGASVIKTSLDAHIQSIAMAAVRDQLRELKHQNVLDGALLVLETKTGRPVAYVANGGPGLTTAAQVDGVQSRRQLGSTIKAFVYGTAYELNSISTTSLLLDSPENVGVGNGQVYQPRNYDHVFRGQVGAAEALGSSLNVPAVRVLSLVSERRVIEKLRELGFEDLKDDDQYGPSLALGTVDASLWELAQGYRQLSLYSDSKVFSESAKRQIFESLSIAENRRFTFGVESLLQLPFAVAAKTGTSKDMRDNWCVGYTSEYTVAAWVGNFNGDPMWNVSGITGAAPLWRKLMLALHRDRWPKDPMLNYKRPDPALPTRSLSRIRYPVDDMLIGIDPDIPGALQKVPLRVEGSDQGMSFYMNGMRIGSADQLPYWKPVKGKHLLQLRNRLGKIVDKAEFVVR